MTAAGDRNQRDCAARGHTAPPHPGRGARAAHSEIVFDPCRGRAQCGDTPVPGVAASTATSRSTLYARRPPATVWHACRRALAIAVICFAAASYALTASAETFRFFGSAGAEAQLTPANESSPLNPRNVAAIPYRTNVSDATTFAEAVGEDRSWKIHIKARAESSDRGADRLQFGEGFLQLNPRKWLDVTAGRVIEKWGTGYAWNPTAFVSPEKNPTDPSDRRSAYRGVDMIKTDLFLAGTNLSLYAMEHRAFAARVYRLVKDTDVSLNFLNDRTGSREGISAARVFGDALELHGEAAHVDAPSGSYTRLLAGGQYTFPHSVNLVVEMYHGGDGLSAEAWRDFCQLADHALTPADLRAANGAYSPLRMGRDYAFTRLDVPWWSRNDVELITITNLRDRSSIIRATYTRKLVSNLSAYVIETEFTSPRGGEFDYVQIKRATTFGARFYF